MSAGVNVTVDKVPAAIKAAIAAVDAQTPEGRALTAVLGRAAGNVLVAHFRKLSAVPNKLGGKRTFFWTKVADAVQSPQPQSGGFSITVSHPHVAQKVYGGMIKPTKAKNLSIAMRPDAYDKSPRLFSDLAYIRLKKKPQISGMLVAGYKKLITRGPNKGKERLVPIAGKLIPYYILLRSVTQKPQANALPEDADYEEPMQKAADLFFEEE
jgi:hypothetical protein